MQSDPAHFYADSTLIMQFQLILIKAFPEPTFNSDANPDPTVPFKKCSKFILVFQSGNFSRVAGAGAALFGWSRSCFFGTALAPTPTLL